MARSKTKKSTTGPKYVPAPQHLEGKELEKLCLMDAEHSNEYTMNRYGVQVSYRRINDKMALTPLKSLPDFEGLLPGGHHFIIECKVCSGPSLSLQESSVKERQLRHMLRRSEFGGTCFFLIHFNERVLKTKTEKAVTYAFPVHVDCTFWEWHSSAEAKRIQRLDCSTFGARVRWYKPPKCVVPRPNLLKAIKEVKELDYE